MIKILVKNRLLAIFNSVTNIKTKKNPNSSPAKKAAVAVLALAIVGLLLFYVVFLEVLFAEALIKNGGGWLYYAIFMLMSLTISIVLGIFETKNELFECKDNELLLSMPIKPSAILGARAITVFIVNFITDAFVMIPAIIIYGIFSADIAGIAGGFIVFLFLPFLCTAIGAAIGFVVTKISKFFKNRAIVSVLFFAAFFVAYMYVYGIVIDGMEEFIADVALNLNFIEKEAAILYHIGLIALLSPLHTPLFIIGCLGAATVAFALISKGYLKLITTNKGAPRVKYVEKKLKQSGAVMAITKKEFRRLTTSGIYMFNAGLGAIIPIVLAVMAIINADTLTAFAAFFPEGLISMAAAALSSMTFMTACVISLEGSAFWIIKTMPVSARTIILAKTLPQLIICLPVSIISAAVFAVLFDFSVVGWACIILTSLFANVFFAYLGIICNIQFPRFDYPSDAHAVKQSASSLITMMGQMAITIGVAAIGFVMLDNGVRSEVLLILSPAVYLVLAMASLLVAFIPCAKKLENLNL